jgi:tetratricopeptide (TPR) repeat protein
MKNSVKKEILKDYLKNLKFKKFFKFIKIFFILYLVYVLFFSFFIRIRGKNKYYEYKKNMYTKLLYKEIYLLIKYYRRIGEINIYQQNYDLSYENFSKILEIGKNELSKNKNLAKKMFSNFCRLGNVYEEKGEKEKALENYKIAKEINIKYLESDKKKMSFIDEKLKI